MQGANSHAPSSVRHYSDNCHDVEREMPRNSNKESRHAEEGSSSMGRSKRPNRRSAGMRIVLRRRDHLRLRWPVAIRFAELTLLAGDINPRLDLHATVR